MHWYFSENGNSVGPVSLDEMKSHLESGRISAANLVWTKAFGYEWKRLDEVDEFKALLPPEPPPIPTSLPAPPPIPVAAPAEPSHDYLAGSRSVPPPIAHTSPSTSAGRAYPPYRNHVLGKVLFWLFRAELLYWIVLSFVPIISRENGRFAARSLEEQYRFTVAMESDGWLMVGGVITLVPMVIFLIWKYRLTANVFNLKGRQSVTPAGAVYWYFVPVAFLWKPYEAMRNLFVALTPPTSHGLVVVWWGLALTATLVAPITYFAFSSGQMLTIGDVRFYVFGTMAINVITAISVYVGAELVKTLTEADKEAVQAAGRRA